MIFFHKILSSFFLPIFSIIIILAIGVIKNKKIIIFCGIVILYLLSIPIFSNNFFKLVEGSEYKRPIASIGNADAIVVLSGMLEIVEVADSIYIDWGDPDRFFGGIDLLKAEKAKIIVFTGGKMPWNRAKKTEGEILKKYAISLGVLEKKILVTKEVGNTSEEAIAVKELIRPSKNIILVTSAFHMYRAKKLFEGEGFNVIQYKVDYKALDNHKITLIDFIPSAASLQLTEAGIREIIGRLYYQMRGWFLSVYLLAFSNCH